MNNLFLIDFKIIITQIVIHTILFTRISDSSTTFTSCPKIFTFPENTTKGTRTLDLKISNTILVDNLFHTDTYDKVNVACYRFAGKNTLPRRNNPASVIKDIFRSCGYCDSGHIIPHVNGGNNDPMNYFSQDKGLNRGLWSKLEQSIAKEKYPYTSTIITISFKYEYKHIPVLLPYPPPVLIVMCVMNDEKGITRNNIYNPYIYYCLKVENKPNGIVFERKIDAKLTDVPLATRMEFSVT